MRFVRNEIQTPRLLVAREKRNNFFFYLLVAGVLILIMGFLAFFAVFTYQNLIEERWDIPYRRLQTFALAFGGIGIILYIIGASFLKVPLRKTTYYKVQTIIKSEPFDPPRKGDFTKAIFARLRDLNDEWALFTEVVPTESDFKLPQVVVGPGGVFTLYPANVNPERKVFNDPGTEFERASRKLGSNVNQNVTPIIVFSTPKMVSLYKTYHDVKTRVMNIREISDYFEKRKNKLSPKQQEEIESKIFLMIQGTTPQ